VCVATGSYEVRDSAVGYARRPQRTALRKEGQDVRAARAPLTPPDSSEIPPLQNAGTLGGVITSAPEG